jgi:quinol monooxygenase YgiN
MLRHIVSWKLKATDAQTKAAHAAEIRRRLDSLIPVVPHIQRLTLGIDTADTAGNWDLVLIADYQDAAALAAYQTHPEHQKVAAYIRTVIAERCCVDFQV